MIKNILFIDNDPDFLDTRAESLERSGYTVVKASTLSEASLILENARLHAIVIDVRMRDDDDERDMSGLTLLEESACSAIPAIILTGHPSVKAAVKALRQDIDNKSLAVDFVKKEDGPRALTNAINRALIHPTFRINWDLLVEWKARDTFSLVKLITPDLEGKRLINRAEEFDDLFRRLYYEKEQIRIERLLWQGNGRLALVVFAFRQGMKPESFIVVCGQHTIINREAQHFNEFSPKVPDDTTTVLSEKTRAETTHFAANAYILAGNDLENVQSLIDLYRLGPEKIFNAALKSLYQGTLKSWHQELTIGERGSAPNALYNERLHLTNLDPQQLEERISLVESQIPRLNAKILQTDETLSVYFKNQTFTHHNPIRLFRQIIESEQTDLFTIVPGKLSGDNILVDNSGHTWLTDFAEAGLAPKFWNFVTMEAMIRFDWAETKELQRKYEMENSFVYTDFARPDIRGLEPVMRKPARAIQAIRKLAARTIGNDVVAYQQGLFLLATRRLADFDPVYPVTTTELARLGHILLSMAMIAEILDQEKKNTGVSGPVQSERIRILDNTARIVIVGNRRERLTPQNFVLFKYLYDKANQICTKDELLTVALQNKYDERYLHTLVGRIRKTIEDDPEKPRFLITEHNAGYKLILKPK